MNVRAWTRLVIVPLVMLGLAARPAEPFRKIDLNTATLRELDSLPGIGPSMAQRIVQFRVRNGLFKRIEDLMNVRGIGEKKFLRIKDRIVIGPPAPKPPLRAPHERSQ